LKIAKKSRGFTTALPWIFYHNLQEGNLGFKSNLQRRFINILYNVH